MTDQGNYDIASIVTVMDTLALQLRERIDSREILAVASHHWIVLHLSLRIADTIDWEGERACLRV